MTQITSRQPALRKASPIIWLVSLWFFAHSESVTSTYIFWHPKVAVFGLANLALLTNRYPLADALMKSLFHPKTVEVWG